jgi:hypothetical protein
MDLFTHNDLNTLMQNQADGPCVSIYLPTYRKGKETQQNPIRFKNLLTAAEDTLRQRGMSPAQAEEFLALATELLEDQGFWKYQSNGLAVFISPDNLWSYRLPIDFTELAVVNERFHIKPLLSMLAVNGHFYVLSLSQNRVRFFEGTQATIDEIDLETLPTSLEEALWYVEAEKQLQSHTTTTEGGVDAPQAFHGHGVVDEDDKVRIAQFFRQVDKGLQNFLADEHAPLVLAGVEYLIPIYQEANSYQHLVDESITGNFDVSNPKELHQKAWVIIEPIFTSQQQTARERYHANSNTDIATHDIRDILPAAHHGRVDSLFVARNVQRWGQFNLEDNTLKIHSEAQPGDEDLLDRAAMQTVMNSGNVYVVPSDQMPDSEPIAAIFRY